MDFESFPRMSRNNRNTLMSNRDCSCYFCIRHFTTDQINEWVDQGRTALCPNCDVDSLVPGKVDITTLEQACERFFSAKID